MSSPYTQPQPPYGPHGAWPPPPPPRKQWYRRKAVTIPLGIFGGFVLLGVIGAAFGLGDKPTPAAQTSAAAPTVTVTAPATQAAAAPRTTAAPRSTPPARAAADVPAEAPSSDAGQSWTMPSETGKSLQAAQDDIQDVTDDGIFFTRSHDAMGTGRHQILDRGWQVCSQNIAPGRKITADSDIVFDVVRVTESCP